MRPWPLAHTAADLTVYDAQTDTLIAGDLVFDRHIPALDGSLRGWQSVLDEMAEISADRVVPGHGRAELPWPAGAEPVQAYLDLLASDARKAIDAGIGLADAAGTVGQGAADDWALFDLFNARNATVAYTELEWE